jgi:signal transduction histidine kinase
LDAELLHDKAEAQRIAAAIDDLEDAVTNVIADTRRERRNPHQRGIDLGEVVRERLAFWEVLTRAQQRTLDVRLHPGLLPVDAPRHDLQELVDVLVGNILRHTPSGRAARVTTAPGSHGGAHLIVEDAGLGFSPNAGGAARGSGLGLEIARRVARDSGGTVALGRSDLGGALFDVELGPAKR